MSSIKNVGANPAGGPTRSSTAIPAQGGKVPPGQGGVPPGQGGVPPGQGTAPPGRGGLAPGQMPLTQGGNALSTPQNGAPPPPAAPPPASQTSPDGVIGQSSQSAKSESQFQTSLPTRSSTGIPVQAGPPPPQTPQGSVGPPPVPAPQGGQSPGSPFAPPPQPDPGAQAGPNGQFLRGNPGQPSTTPQGSGGGQTGSPGAGVPQSLPGDPLQGGSIAQNLLGSAGQPSTSPQGGGSFSPAPPGSQAGQPFRAPTFGTPLSEIPRADTPLQDGFRTQFRTATDAAIQGQPVEAPVSALVPSLNDTKTLADVKERFANDYPLLKGQVEDLPFLSDPEKAGRAFEFFEQYAGRFVALATGEAQKARQTQDGDAPPAANEDPEARADVPWNSAAPRDPTLKRPVTGASEADAHFLGTDADPTDELQLLNEPPGDPHAPADGKKGGKEGLSKLDRLLRGELPGEAPSGKDGKPAGAPKERLLTGEFGFGAQVAELPRPAKAREEGARPQPPKPGEAEIQKQAKGFTELLQSFDFDQMRDLASGRDGAQLAYEMLTAGSQAQLEHLAQRKELSAEHWPPHPPEEPEVRLPPEQYHPGTMGKEPSQRLKDLGESRPELDRRFEAERVSGQPERLRTQPWSEGPRPIITPTDRSPRDVRFSDQRSSAADVFGRMGRKLGSNHLWNVLHQLRGQGADSAVEKEKFDQLAFGAICLLSLLTLGVIVLANL